MDLTATTLLFAGLMTLVALTEPLAARLRLPFTVILALIGLALGLGAAWFLATPLTDALNPVAEFLLGLPLTSGLFLTVFLPVLLFQPTLSMELRRMAEDAVPILVLAIVAVVVTTVAVGVGLRWASGLPLELCLLVGAIVSTTDPSATISIFRSIAAPPRLVRIVEGESLLNDAAAIALFALLLATVMRFTPDPEVWEAAWAVPWALAAGGAVGWVVGRVAVALMAALAPFTLAQVTLSAAVPVLAFLGTERLVHASGVVAVVAAGLAVNLAGRRRLAPAAWSRLVETWDLLAHWAGALIFILAALLIPRLLGSLTWGDAGLVAVVFVAATLARAAMLFGVLPGLAAVGLSPAIERRYRLAMLWGGLRGAVTLALGLAVTENALVPAETRRVVALLATGYALATLVGQGATLRWVVTRLGLDRLSAVDAALARQVVATALQSVRERLAETTRDYALTRDVVRQEAVAFGERLAQAVRDADDHVTVTDTERVALSLLALAGAEREMILERFRDGEIGPDLAEAALGQADRLIESTRTDGRMGYRRQTRMTTGRSVALDWALRLHSRLGLSGALARLTAERFEILLLQRLLLPELDGFVDGRIRRIHGRRVADLLHDLLAQRTADIDQALAGLRLQYPGYADALERRFIRRRARLYESQEYDALRAEGLIGDELHARLRAGLATDTARPRLDLAVQKDELVAALPLVAKLDPASRRRLARALRTRFVAPGDVLLRRGETSRAVHFIASGAVEAELAGHRTRLGPGQMFGALSMLSPKARRAEVRAITHGVLLTLDDADFRRLLSRSTAFRDAVRQAAVDRDAPPDVLAAIG